MPRVAIGPRTCGLRLTPAGLAELRRRRGQGTWYYAAEFADRKAGDSLAIRRYRLVPPEDYGTPDTSHAVPYAADMGEAPSVAEAERHHRDRIYEHSEAKDRTDPDLLDMVDRPGGDWFGTEVKVLDIPDGIEWYVHEDEDGSESVHERHRTWS